jgi:hypothetical protein
MTGELDYSNYTLQQLLRARRIATPLAEAKSSTSENKNVSAEQAEYLFCYRTASVSIHEFVQVLDFQANRRRH